MRASMSRLFVLCQGKPIAETVFEDSFDAVRAFGWWRQEFDTAPFQLFIGRLAVIGLESARAQRAFFDERADLFSRLFVEHHSAFRFHQSNFEIGLLPRRNREPTETISHRCIGAYFKAKLLDIKLVSLILVGDVDCCVRKFLD